MTDLYAPVIPRLMARLAAIQRGEREHAKPKERRLETDLRSTRGGESTGHKSGAEKKRPGRGKATANRTPDRA